MRDKVIFFILVIICSVLLPAFGEDLSSLNREWDKAGVEWTYNPWKLLFLDFIPDPVVSLDGDSYYGYVARVGSRKNIYGGTTVYFANVLLPKELGKNRFESSFYSDYKETVIGTKLSDFTGDEGWYNWETLWRHSGVSNGAIWTFAGSLSFRMLGIVYMGLAPALYYSGEAGDMTQEDMYKMVGIGVGSVLIANLIDLLERGIRALQYRRIAKALND